MITGFNTDVRHGEVVFHVQTEDKGTGNPCVETLVYVGGQILARKRSGYRSLLDDDDPKAAITQLMEQQHQTMIAAIKKGRMDEKAATIVGPSKTPEPAAESGPVRVEPPAEVEPAEPTPVDEEPAEPVAEGPDPAAEKAPPPEEPVPPSKTVVAPLKSLLYGRGAQSAPPEAASPSPPETPSPAPESAEPERVEEPSSPEPPDDRSLDQVILDYLEMESEQEKLVLSMDRRAGELAPGKTTTVSFRTRSSLAAEPIPGAKVAVRLISTIEEPLLLGEGRTDDTGQIELTLEVPMLKTGTGALIVTAESVIGNAEMRHLI